MQAAQLINDDSSREFLLSSRSEHICELNEEFTEQELTQAYETTNAQIMSIKQQKDERLR